MQHQTCPHCQEKEKKMRVIQSDTEFELKKMTEDLAEEKVLLEMQFQKEYKKAMQKYNKEKKEREDENKKWMTKYDSMVSHFQLDIQKLHIDHEQAQESLKDQLISKYGKKEQEKNTQHQNEVQTLKKQHEHTVHSLKEKQSKQIKLLQKHEEDSLKDLQNGHEEAMESVKTEYETKVSQLKKEISEISESRDNLKKQAHLKQASLYQQLCQNKEVIAGLKYQIDHLNITIKNCQQEIRFKNLEIQVLKEQHQETLSQANCKFESQKSSIIQGFNLKIEEILMNKLKDCNDFEQNVKEIEAKREQEVKIFESSLKEVQQLVEIRPSRSQDLEQITLLKELLSQKEKEIEKAAEQAKGFKLQLDYKESTFNRIFPLNQSPLNIQKIVSKKKDLKVSRSSISLFKEQNKYSSVKTIHTISNTCCDFRKEKQPLVVKTLKNV